MSKVIASSKSMKFHPNKFDEYFNRRTVSAADGTPPVRREYSKVSVIIYPDMCLKDAFTEPFKLGLVELSSNAEKEVLAKLQGDNMQSMFMALGFAAMRTFNGRMLTPDEAEMVWGDIRFVGRFAIMEAFLNHCTGFDEEQLKKLRSTVTLE
jgi:hypothetical protein